MGRNHLIGVDLGTSIVKATLFDVDGNALADAEREVQIHYPKPGLAEQRGEDFLASALAAIGEIVEKTGIKASSVVSIAFSGQMAGAIGIDRDWQPLTPWYPSALDIRYQPYVQEMQRLAGDRLIELSGAQPFASPRMLWWKNEQGDLYKRIHKVVVLSSYVAGAMAGLKGDEAFIEPSYLTWFGAADTSRYAWSDELIDLFDLEKQKLPRIVSAITIIGKLSREAAGSCGLVSGIPLVAGTGDQVASALGAGLVQHGQLIDCSGTFSVFTICLNRFLPDVRHGMLHPLACPLSDSHWYSMMYISGGGLTHKWFCEQFGLDGDRDSAGMASTVYQCLDKQAAALPPGSEGLLFVPHLIGRSCPPDPNVRGTWIGFTWTHEKRHFYRAILESIAYDYAQALGVIRDYLPNQEFKEVRVIGGGAVSDMWNQIKSDVLGIPYARLKRANTAATGVAILAGCATGVYSDMAETAGKFAATE